MLCAARGISTARTIATRKSAGTSAIKWPRSAGSLKAWTPHDRAVNHARPHGKPDEARARIRISRGGDQKSAQCRIHSADHQQIVRMSVAPSPARRPHNAQGVYAKYER